MSYFTKKQNSAPCPCGSGRTLAQCCGKFIDLEETPRTALEVMRARYTAYALGHNDFIRASWAMEKCPEGVLADPEYKWIGLKVVSAKDIDETHAEVEFIARARAGSRGSVRMHERSRFEKRDGLWFYVDGDMLEK